MNSSIPSALPATDLDRAAALADLLGPVRLVALLDILRDRLGIIAAAMTGLPESREDITSMVHQSQGSAGSLGLNGVMALLQGVETGLAAAHGHAALASDISSSQALLASCRQLIEHRLLR